MKKIVIGAIGTVATEQFVATRQRGRAAVPVEAGDVCAAAREAQAASSSVMPGI